MTGMEYVFALLVTVPIMLALLYGIWWHIKAAVRFTRQEKH